MKEENPLHSQPASSMGTTTTTEAAPSIENRDQNSSQQEHTTGSMGKEHHREDAGGDRTGRPESRGDQGDSIQTDKEDGDVDSSSSRSLTHSSNIMIQRYCEQGKELAQKYVVTPVTVVAVAMLLTGQYQLFVHTFVKPLIQMIFTVIGVTVGLSLALGLSMHVYDQLQDWHHRDRAGNNYLLEIPRKNGSYRSLASSSLLNTNSALGPSTSIGTINNATSFMENEQTYKARMTTAGYPPPTSMARGQICRNKDSLTPYYKFDTKVPFDKLQLYFPNNPVNLQLSKWIDIIMKDFIASWYCKVDSGVQYNRPDTASSVMHQSSLFLCSIASYRRVPFIDHLYDSMAILFGNLATRFEHVNLLEITLLKWTQILSRTFQQYRQIRKRVSLETNPEMAIAKEFLIANQVHPAVIYGLDVPSLLFADADGKECPVSVSETSSTPHKSLQVLEERFFPIMKECELDYHRVLSNRMMKTLLARHDASCHMLQGLLTEILASCVLSPILGLFAPETVNGWIVMGLGGNSGAATTTEEHTLPEQLERSSPDELLEVVDDNDEEDDLATSLQSTGEDLLTQLTSSIIALREFVDFEDYREGTINHSSIKWDDPVCRTAVLKLVLIIEAILSDGRCTYKGVPSVIQEVVEDEGDDTEVSFSEYEPSTLSQVLMELTSDIDAFEERALTENNRLVTYEERYKTLVPGKFERTATEQSTTRTLIAAWLHSGQVHRVLSIISEAKSTVLLPYYMPSAFLRSGQTFSSFLRQLKALDGVDVLVDTMAALASPRLDEGEDALHTFVRQSSSSTNRNNRESAIAIASQFMLSSPTTPRYCDFHRNEAFASSLRSERERRFQSWHGRFQNDDEEGVPIIIHAGASESHRNAHKDLHKIAKTFYSATNLVSIRDAARRKNSSGTEIGSLSEASDANESIEMASLLTIDAAGPTRRIEIPDDDSSFLLRAQPRALNAVGVHRDQRNHEHSYRCFTASFEEPIIRPDSDHYAGARFVRYCLIRYYPIDKTATVVISEESRQLDQRKLKGSVPGIIKIDSRHAPVLSSNFLKDRHLCQRWNPKGSSRTQSLLASNVMEPTDFTSVPRNGRAIDFVYRMAFFENPMVDLGGKHFTLHDSSTIGTHRADASSLELSDAVLSAALLSFTDRDAYSTGGRPVELGKDGYPIVWMRTNPQQENGKVELKPFRLSFVRAALLITSARQEARFQSLIKCVKAGSAKKATRALNDAQLKPVTRLLEYSSHASREKQSLVLRDLKLGVNHIDVDQLRRNGLYNPRFPTKINELEIEVEDVLSSDEIRDVYLPEKGIYYYKIRCTAVVEFVGDGNDMENDLGYAFNGRIGRLFKEEWIVYRSYKEFQVLHKHLKTQVSSSESSGTAGSRLVGVASAALSSGGSHGRNRNRNILIPSLAQATKIGALGLTHKSLLKRKEFLKSYLDYLSSPGHPLSRCTELLLFVGAFYPFPPDVSVGASVSGVQDPLGRSLMRRTVVEEEVLQTNKISAGPDRERTLSFEEPNEDGDDFNDEQEALRSPAKDGDMIPSVRAKIDRVPLATVRNRLFDLLRYLFGFENASFVRNRMLAALKTASFAVTSRTEFRRMLYKIHTERISGDAIGGLLDYVLNMLWPDGIFFTPAPPLTEEEKEEAVVNSKEALHGSFPEALRAILGQELTKDGIDIFHEMLQNRLVLRSMTHHLLAAVWNEAFPELSDILADAPSLDLD